MAANIPLTCILSHDMNSTRGEMTGMILLLVAYVCIIALIAIRKSYILKKAGSCHLCVRQRSIKLIIVVLALCCVVPFLVFRINFSVYVKIMLVSAGLLGAYMMVSMLATASCEGVYDNGVIADGSLILFSDMKSFKQPDEQSEVYGKHVLEIDTCKHGKKRILYTDERECDAVMEALRAIK